MRDLSGLVAQWAVTRRARARLRAERQADPCERLAENSSADDDGGATGYFDPHVTPCWKELVQDHPDRERHLRPDEMCSACQRNGERRAREIVLARRAAGLAGVLMRRGLRLAIENGWLRSVDPIPSAESLSTLRLRLDAAEKLAEAVDRLPWKGSPLGEAYTAYRSAAREDERE